MAWWHERPASSDGESRVGSHGFLIAVSVALAASVLLIAVMRADKSTSALASYKGPHLVVHGVQYDEPDSSGEPQGGQTAGRCQHEFLLGLNDGGLGADGKKVGDTFSYRFSGKDKEKHPVTADIESPVKIGLSGSRGDSVDYRITSKDSKEAKAWNALVTAPRQRDPENPVGTWRLVVESPKQSWAHMTWLTVRGDGTGEFGSIDKSASTATAAELAKATRPCTVTREEVDGGVKLVARYEGGTYVLTVTGA